MRALAMPEAGAAPAILDVEVPEPAPGEVLVRVSAASVNGFDLAVAAGYMTDFFEHRYPLVLGREFAGVVEALGEGVDGVAVGDPVFGVVSKPHLAEGAFAEYTTAVAGSGVAVAPASLSPAHAASLGHTGSTALAILHSLGDVADATVLVVGSTGGVGTLLVQLLADAGAIVIATGRTADGRELLSSLGAAHTVDYAELAFAVRTIAPGGVDAAVHLAGDATQIAALVREGGLLVSPLLYSPEGLPGTEHVGVVPIAAYPTAEGLRTLAELVEAGRLRVVIDREHAFDEVESAFWAFGRETIGNIVVHVR